VFTFLECRHARPHIDHDACTFVPRDGREQAFQVGAAEPVLVGVADAGGLDLDQHFARARTVQVHGLDGQRGAGFPGNGCAGLHVVGP